MNSNNEFVSDAYVRHNQARWEHLKSLNILFKGKTVLEVGAGIGDHTQFLLEQGIANVTVLEGREENVNVLKQRYANIENVEIRHYNLDAEFHAFIGQKFDIVYCYGLLYHVAEVESLLQFLYDHTAEILLLETCVDYFKKDTLNLIEENKNAVSQSLTGTGCRPGRNWLFSKLQALYPYVYVPKTQPDHEEFPLDWTYDNIDTTLSRAIFIASFLPQSKQIFFDSLVMFQKNIHPKCEKEIYRYYSQHGEDYLLWNFFDYKNEGFYVEVGAFDGAYLSNTYSFEQKGWSGICIEPLPDYYKMCKRNRPNSITLNMACVGDATVKEVAFNAEISGVLSSINDSDDYHQDLQQRYNTSGFEFNGIEKINVSAMTLNNILSKYLPKTATLDFISIDVEAYEEEVLRGFDIDLYRPRVVIIEANDSDSEKRITEIMFARHGYYLARRVFVNLIFVSTLEDVARMQNISIDCAIEKQMHPLGVEYSFAPYVRGVICNETKDRQLALKDQQLQKRLELLQRNGSNWMASKKENERLLSKEFFFSQLQNLYSSLNAISKNYPRYIIYGTNEIAQWLYSISPSSTVAFITENFTDQLMYKERPLLTYKTLKEFEKLPIILVSFGHEEEIIDELMQQSCIQANRIISM